MQESNAMLYQLIRREHKISSKRRANREENIIPFPQPTAAIVDTRMERLLQLNVNFSNPTMQCTQLLARLNLIVRLKKYNNKRSKSVSYYIRVLLLATFYTLMLQNMYSRVLKVDSLCSQFIRCVEREDITKKLGRCYVTCCQQCTVRRSENNMKSPSKYVQYTPKFRQKSRELPVCSLKKEFSSSAGCEVFAKDLFLGKFNKVWHHLSFYLKVLYAHYPL